MLTNNIQDTLDLHGETKEKAIAKLTSFFDTIRLKHKYKMGQTQQQQFVVTIVTGSGSHGFNGPVLRNAVEKTLKKRKMTYHPTHKKGAFNVDALSGIDLFEEPKQDSKILTVQSEEFSILTNRNDGAGYNLNKKYTKSPSRQSTCETVDPSPAELASDDEKISTVKEISLREASLAQSEKSKEANELEKAFILSQNEEMAKRGEMEKNMKEVIEMSKQTVHSKEEDQHCFEQQIQNAIELSKLETQVDLEKESLKYAMLISQREAEQIQKQSGEQNNMGDEQSLQLALKLSMSEM